MLSFWVTFHNLFLSFGLWSAVRTEYVKLELQPSAVIFFVVTWNKQLQAKP
jgi:hypothetical protein